MYQSSRQTQQMPPSDIQSPDQKDTRWLFDLDPLREAELARQCAHAHSAKWETSLFTCLKSVHEDPFLQSDTSASDDRGEQYCDNAANMCGNGTIIDGAYDTAPVVLFQRFGFYERLISACDIVQTDETSQDHVDR